MESIILAAVIINFAWSVRSHRSLRRAFKETKDLILGRVREVGPVEAQTQALKANARERAAARRAQPRPINL